MPDPQDDTPETPEEKLQTLTRDFQLEVTRQNILIKVLDSMINEAFNSAKLECPLGRPVAIDLIDDLTRGLLQASNMEVLEAVALDYQRRVQQLYAAGGQRYFPIIFRAATDRLQNELTAAHQKWREATKADDKTPIPFSALADMCREVTAKIATDLPDGIIVAVEAVTKPANTLQSDLARMLGKSQDETGEFAIIFDVDWDRVKVPGYEEAAWRKERRLTEKEQAAKAANTQPTTVQMGSATSLEDVFEQLIKRPANG